jgi:hypothetical protein
VATLLIPSPAADATYESGRLRTGGTEKTRIGGAVEFSIHLGKMQVRICPNTHVGRVQEQFHHLHLPLSPVLLSSSSSSIPENCQPDSRQTRTDKQDAPGFTVEPFRSEDSERGGR